MIFNKWDPCWKVCLSDNKGKEKERTSLLRLFKPYKRENLFEEVENLSQRTVVTADSDGVSLLLPSISPFIQNKLT